ncbi:NAD(P)-binding protein [Polyplosphaeria fusca]|uniref:NAD(P)-binding protein n=1 Tax=Polyplosphaeria fusca TaxID=682080 RepID=A0A9P4QQ34_9PLEO|nr:NAD(P)-binding protein [Polyplosphaeria fusca]
MPSPPPQTRTIYRRNLSSPSFAQKIQLETEPIPPLTSTSLLLKLHAISLNYRDANMLNATNPWPVLASGIPCSDAAGEIVAIGPRVSRFKLGDRVCPIIEPNERTGREWLGGDVDGVLASHVVVEEAKVVRVPEGLEYVEAAMLPVAGVTAWAGVRGVRAGGSVLVQGTGGVSMFGAKLARAMGCRVILSSSSDEKLARVKEMGGLESVRTLNYARDAKWEDEAVRLNDGVGVDVVLENGGTSSLMQSLKATRKGGTVSQIGYLGKQDGRHLDGLVSVLIEKEINLRGINVGSRADFEDMNRLIESNDIRFNELIDKKFEFERAGEAFEYLWSGQHVGKIVIEI